MIEYCGDPLCAARVEAFQGDREDGGVLEPCPQCVDALIGSMQRAADDLARIMRSVNAVIAGRL